MFNKTAVENKTVNIAPASPENLRLVTDKKGKQFVFQLEYIISVEPYFDVRSNPDYCCVNMADGEKIWVSLSASDLYTALKKD
ncbi:hypothetical protein [Candidatus Pantoea formicae]|uniref:hypothetical protein n=1 Tax=Candidatus Pantoea formicae TaxID=2608355 RepID=UPI003ED958A4